MRKIRAVKTELENNMKLQDKLKAEIAAANDKSAVSLRLHGFIFNSTLGRHHGPGSEIAGQDAH